MFTGLIQGLGTIETLVGDRLNITCTPQVSGLILPDLAIGDSVAVDGVCLTVVDILTQGFTAVVSPETRDRSTLGTLPGAWVNLETSLRVGSKLGGHFVTGHVDGIGYLQSATPTDSSWELRVTTSPLVSRYIIPKGSIAVNGISLTVADCDASGSWFTVAVIPHTYQETNLQYLQPGSPVNLEGDLLGKYVERFVRLGDAAVPRPAMMLDHLSPDFLAEHGYL